MGFLGFVCLLLTSAAFRRERPSLGAESTQLLSFISWHWDFGIEKARQNQQHSAPWLKIKKNKRLCLLQCYWNPWGCAFPRDWRRDVGKRSGWEKVWEGQCWENALSVFSSPWHQRVTLELGSQHRLRPRARRGWSWGDEGEHPSRATLPGQEASPCSAAGSVCSAGSVAALAGSGTARSAVIKHQSSLFGENKHTFQSVLPMNHLYLFKAENECKIWSPCFELTWSISGMSKVECPFLVVIWVHVLPKAAWLDVDSLIPSCAT